jgi:hypothetical protein
VLHTHLAALALAVTALAVSGCGGSTKSSSQTALSTPTATSPKTEPANSTGPLNRAALVAKADAICRGVNAKRATVHLTTNQQIIRELPHVAAYERAEIAELGKLTPPASMASDWQEILVGNRILAENTAKVAEYTKADNVTAAHALMTTTTQAENQMIATAQRDGFKDCAKP